MDEVNKIVKDLTEDIKVSKGRIKSDGRVFVVCTALSKCGFYFTIGLKICSNSARKTYRAVVDSMYHKVLKGRDKMVPYTLNNPPENILTEHALAQNSQQQKISNREKSPFDDYSIPRGGPKDILYPRICG